MSSNHPDQLFWATRWTVIDVVALVITAFVLGVVFYLWGWAMQGLSGILGEVGSSSPMPFASRVLPSWGNSALPWWRSHWGALWEYSCWS
jgi:high-affinity Fe2+/Pb2+ permease